MVFLMVEYLAIGQVWKTVLMQADEKVDQTVLELVDKKVEWWVVQLDLMKAQQMVQLMVDNQVHQQVAPQETMMDIETAEVTAEQMVVKKVLLMD